MVQSTNRFENWSRWTWKRVASAIWKSVPFIPHSAVIPVLCATPIIGFLLFVWLVNGLSAIQ